MANMKCKICGGQMVPGQNGDLVCESCGSIVQQTDLRAQAATGTARQKEAARQLMLECNYSSAYSIYENLLTQNPQDAETRWYLVLCRYGILYQKDTLTGEWMPTVNRMRYDSILEDPDYKAVLAAVDTSTRNSLARDAGQIARIQERYLTIAQQEEPCDVFISYKSRNADGTRSRDSVIGQEIYEDLTAHGLRVFYADITLENKGGEEYEPYIFSALNTARVMLLIGTRGDYVRAPWVANEWQRYLALMQQRPDCRMIPVYEGMDPSDYPQEIPQRDAVNYAVQGACAALTEEILAITGKGVVIQAENSREAISKMIDALRAAVEQGDYQRAWDIADAVLDIDAENSDAYLYMLLAHYKVRRITDLADIDEDWTQSRHYTRALQFADPARKQLLAALVQRREMRIEDARKNRVRRIEAEKRDAATGKALTKARELLANKDYKGAFRQLQHAGGDPQVRELLAYSKAGMEARSRLTRTAVEQVVKKENPAAYSRMLQLQEAADKAHKGDVKASIRMVALCIAVPIGIIVITGLLIHGMGEPWETAIGGLVGTPTLAIGTCATIQSVRGLLSAYRGDKAREALQNHMTGVMEPIYSDVIEDIREEYETVLGDDLEEMIRAYEKEHREYQSSSAEDRELIRKYEQWEQEENA